MKGNASKPLSAVNITILFASLGLVLAYFFAARKYGFFVYDFSYTRGEAFTFQQYQKQSILLKFLLLVPAAAGLALFLTRVNFDLRIGRFFTKKQAPWLLGLASSLIIILLVVFAFHQSEVTDDEMTFEFQAQTLLGGSLINPPPPAADTFENVWIINADGKFLGKYPVGHPLVLAGGHLLGSPYVLTVFLSVMLLPLMFGIGLRLFRDRRRAALSSLMLFVSPFFYFVSASKFSQITVAFSLAAFMYLFLRVSDHDNSGPSEIGLALLAGLAAGYAFNVRQLTAVTFLLPFATVAAWRMLRRRKLDIKPLVMVVGFALVTFGTLWYNQHVTGDWFTFTTTFETFTDQIGFGGFNEHTPAKALKNLLVIAVKMNLFLFGLPIGLGFVLAALVKRPKNFGEKLCLGIVVSTCAGYFLYWFPGDSSDLGPVYYYETLIPLILLSASGFVWLYDRLRVRSEWAGLALKNFLIATTLLAAFLFAENTWKIHKLTQTIQAPYAVMEEKGIHNALVFIDDLPPSGNVFFYRNNSPDLGDDILLGKLLGGQQNAAAADAFPDRELYVMTWNQNDGAILLLPVTKQQLTDGSWTTTQ